MSDAYDALLLYPVSRLIDNWQGSRHYRFDVPTNSLYCHPSEMSQRLLVLHKLLLLVKKFLSGKRYKKIEILDYLVEVQFF
jgi:hypothetical protein